MHGSMLLPRCHMPSQSGKEVRIGPAKVRGTWETNTVVVALGPVLGQIYLRHLSLHVALSLSLPPSPSITINIIERPSCSRIHLVGTQPRYVSYLSKRLNPYCCKSMIHPPDMVFLK